MADRRPSISPRLPSAMRLRLLVLCGGLLGIFSIGGAIRDGIFPPPAVEAGGISLLRQNSPSEVAYFMFDYPPNPETFIFELSDPVKIALARNILSGQEPPHHIMGTILKQLAIYNPPWSYHLDPSSISFFDNALEVCDASIQYVEDHLQEVCDAFLPGCGWCPWNSRLLSEVYPPITPTPTATALPSGPHFIYLPISIKGPVLAP